MKYSPFINIVDVTSKASLAEKWIRRQWKENCSMKCELLCGEGELLPWEQGHRGR